MLRGDATFTCLVPSCMPPSHLPHKRSAGLLQFSTRSLCTFAFALGLMVRPSGPIFPPPQPACPDFLAAHLIPLPVPCTSLDLILHSSVPSFHAPSCLITLRHPPACVHVAAPVSSPPSGWGGRTLGRACSSIGGGARLVCLWKPSTGCRGRCRVQEPRRRTTLQAGLHGAGRGRKGRKQAAAAPGATPEEARWAWE